MQPFGLEVNFMVLQPALDVFSSYTPGASVLTDAIKRFHQAANIVPKDTCLVHVPLRLCLPGHGHEDSTSVARCLVEPSNICEREFCPAPTGDQVRRVVHCPGVVLEAAHLPHQETPPPCKGQ